jgi:predicted nucleic acid-binding protein
MLGERTNMPQPCAQAVLEEGASASGHLDPTRARGAPWALPWPCIHEFLAIATHPRIWDPPTPMDSALDQVDAWLESPSLVLLAEGPDHSSELRAQIETGRIVGPRVHDARIAAVCLAHGVRELWTADRDFGRFPALATSNPLVE